MRRGWIWGLLFSVLFAAPSFAEDRLIEVRLLYKADATPNVLRIRNIKIKHGSVPTPEPVEHGYTVSLVDESVNVLHAVAFIIPNIVEDPPTEFDEPGPHGRVVFKQMEFMITLPWISGTKTVDLTDPQGQLIESRLLKHVKEEKNTPKFRRHKHHEHSWQWIPDAYAQTETLRVVYIGDNYTQADSALFLQNVQSSINYMMTYEPYKSNAAKLEFSSVENYTVDLGCKHNTSITRLITCNSATITSTVNTAGAPYDKIIVLVKDGSYGGSGGGTLAVSYNGSSRDKVVVHEFGHTLGNLRDEYTSYSGGSIQNRAYYNCYLGKPPATLVEWTGAVSGCTYGAWYRPGKPSTCSIMKSLSCTSFNDISKALLLNRIDYYVNN